jgi:hypothetical protein
MNVVVCCNSKNEIQFFEVQSKDHIVIKHNGWNQWRFMDEHFSDENISFKIEYFHSIPFNSITKVLGWKDRRSVNRRFSAENIPFEIKIYYRAYIVTFIYCIDIYCLDGNVAYLRNNSNMSINVLFIIWRGAFKTCFFCILLLTSHNFFDQMKSL